MPEVPTKRILFVGHEATRTGAPLVLLYLLRWLGSKDPNFHPDLLLLTGGDLEDEYRKVANVFLMQPNGPQSLLRRVKGRIERAFGFEYISSLPKLPHAKYDVAVGNTVLSLRVLEHFKRKGGRTICWAHELGDVVRSIYAPTKFAELCGSVDRFIAGSKAVARMLSDTGAVKAADVVYEFSTPHDAMPDRNTFSHREKLGIPADAFVVLGCGSIERRKGVDIFAEIAAALISRFPDIYFVWIGGVAVETNAQYFREIESSSAFEQAGKRLIFPGSLANPWPIFSTTDIFALTSREDPFPLVCLDAAAFNKPTICFEDAGGIPEFVEDNAGRVVPYGDVKEFCDAIAGYYIDRNALRRAGEIAKQKFSSSFAPDRSCQKIHDILNDK